MKARIQAVTDYINGVITLADLQSKFSLFALNETDVEDEIESDLVVLGAIQRFGLNEREELLHRRLELWLEQHQVQK
jgi:hypothetical protein